MHFNSLDERDKMEDVRRVPLTLRPDSPSLLRRELSVWQRRLWDLCGVPHQHLGRRSPSVWCFDRIDAQNCLRDECFFVLLFRRKSIPCWRPRAHVSSPNFCDAIVATGHHACCHAVYGVLHPATLVAPCLLFRLSLVGHRNAELAVFRSQCLVMGQIIVLIDDRSVIVL